MAEEEPHPFEPVFHTVTASAPSDQFRHNIYSYFLDFLKPSELIQILLNENDIERLKAVPPYPLSQIAGAAQLIISDPSKIVESLLSCLISQQDLGLPKFRNCLRIFAIYNIGIACITSFSDSQSDQLRNDLLCLACLTLHQTPSNAETLVSHITKVFRSLISCKSSPIVYLAFLSLLLLKFLKGFLPNPSVPLVSTADLGPKNSPLPDDPNNLEFLLVGQVPSAYETVEKLRNNSVNQRTSFFFHGKVLSDAQFKPGRKLLSSMSSFLKEAVTCLSKYVDMKDQLLGSFSWCILDLLSIAFHSSHIYDGEMLSELILSMRITDTFFKIINSINVKKGSSDPLPKNVGMSTVEISYILPQFMKIGAAFSFRLMARIFSFVPWRIAKYLDQKCVVSICETMSQQSDDLLSPAMAYFVSIVGFWVFKESRAIPSNIVGPVYLNLREFDLFPTWPSDPVHCLSSEKILPETRVCIKEEDFLEAIKKHSSDVGLSFEIEE